MPSMFKKAPRQLPLEGCEGVEKKKKFAVGRVIKWGLIIYCAFVFRSCLYNMTPQQPQQPKGKSSYSTLEQVLPSSPAHYNSSNLEIRKNFLGGSSVYKEGVNLGVLGETNLLINDKREVVGYISNAEVYNSTGQKSGSVYKGDVFDLNGNKLGNLKTKNNNLESIVDGDKKIASIGSVSYVIMAQQPGSADFKIIGIIDNYKK